MTAERMGEAATCITFRCIQFYSTLWSYHPWSICKKSNAMINTYAIFFFLQNITVQVIKSACSCCNKSPAWTDPATSTSIQSQSTLWHRGTVKFVLSYLWRVSVWLFLPRCAADVVWHTEAPQDFLFHLVLPTRKQLPACSTYNSQVSTSFLLLTLSCSSFSPSINLYF